MNSKYQDVTAIMQVIGCIYNNIELLDLTDKYTITEDDFCNEFHKIVFGSIYKIHELGAKTINLETISDFLSSRPKAKATYDSFKGEEWLLEVSNNAVQETFNYYYNRMKKMTLLREFDAHGIDVSSIYDPDNILDAKKKQAQEDKLDNSSLLDIANKVAGIVDEIKYKYVNNEYDDFEQAGNNVLDLIEELKKNPEVGVPLYGPLINTITKGARLTKFYLRSAPTGKGKTRSMIADACYIGCDMIYYDEFGWLHNGIAEPVLFISTEQKIDEIQTMMLAFLANVDEDHIIGGNYEGDEEERVKKAAEILMNSPIYINELPDFSLQDIEDHIKKGVRDFDVKYVFSEN